MRARVASRLQGSWLLAFSILAGSGTAWANIELTGGRAIPGNAPRSLSLEDDAFADSAQLITPCPAFSCGTQFTDATHTTRLTVEQAVIGNPPIYTGVDNLGGTLEFRFRERLPKNGPGADLVVFEFATQTTFQIAARTREGAQTSFVTIPSIPFILFDQPKTVDNAGPCNAAFEPPCALFVRFSLLAFEIDLSTLGLPADAVVEAVQVRPLAGTDFPEIARVAALNSQLIGEPSGHIADGTFENCVQDWTVVGPGSTQCTAIPNHGQAVKLMTAGAPQTLRQTITTPPATFMVNFAHRFGTTAGRLVVDLNGTVLADIAAPAALPATFTYVEHYVNSPALMGLTDGVLSFTLHPGSDTETEIGQVSIPSFLPISSHSEVEAAAFNGQISDLGTHQYFAAALVDVTDDVFLPPNFGSHIIAEGRTATLPLLGGISWGLKAITEGGREPVAGELFIIPNASTTTRGRNQFKILSLGPHPAQTEKVPFDYVLRLNGLFTLIGDPPTDTSTQAGLDVFISHQINNAYISSTVGNAAFPLGGVVGPSLGLNHKAGTDPAVGAAPIASNCPEDNRYDPPLAPDSGPAFTLIEDLLIGGLRHRVYALRMDFCFPAMLHASVGDIVTVSATIRGSSHANAGAIAVADLFNTVEAYLSSQVPDIGVEPVPLPEVTNQPPTANAGLDQTVEATGPTGASVLLDGGGSSDPDAGDTLTYAWSGPFGSASGASPQVTLGLGTHTVTLTVTDPDNASDDDTVQITVQDTTTPVVTAPPDLSVTATGPLTPVDLEQLGQATAQDVVDGAIDPSPDQPGPFAPGSYAVIWMAQDAAGNLGMDTQALQVVEPPAQFAFVGFLEPVENLPTVNTAQAGKGVPLKWQIPDGAGGFVRDLGVVRSVRYELVNCADGAGAGENPVEADTSGQSGLRYDPDTEQFIYVWKTPKSLAGRCADAVVSLTDDTAHRARFEFR